MVGCIVVLFHPAVDVIAALDLPIVDMRYVAESFKFTPDPKRPLAIVARIADENIDHVDAPRDGPL
jgi:hypothetical protein